MKGFFNKALVVALLVSVSGMNAGIGATSMGYVRKGLDYVGSFKGLNGKTFTQNASDCLAVVKNHPYMSGIATAVLALGIYGYKWYAGRTVSTILNPKTVKNHAKRQRKKDSAQRKVEASLAAQA